ncbi:MAG: hypothetical protein U1F43_19680 [Myxococcota bacterium]
MRGRPAAHRLPHEPIRKEAIGIFRQMGISRFGILLSDKDSIVYTHALWRPSCAR